jgi:hypothetical protein
MGRGKDDKALVSVASGKARGSMVSVVNGTDSGTLVTVASGKVDRILGSVASGKIGGGWAFRPGCLLATPCGGAGGETVGGHSTGD